MEQLSPKKWGDRWSCSEPMELSEIRLGWMRWDHVTKDMLVGRNLQEIIGTECDLLEGGFGRKKTCRGWRMRAKNQSGLWSGLSHSAI